MCVCVCRRRRVKARECALNSDDAKLSSSCAIGCVAKKLSVETLNPNSVGAPFEGAFF